MSKTKMSVARQLEALYKRKRVLQGRITNGELLKRREMEELRLSASELRKFMILSTCLVPVGNILIAPIYFNPRRFWPTMLWDLKNHVTYREQENLEKRSFQDDLSSSESLQKVTLKGPPPRIDFCSLSSLESFSTGSLSLSNVSRDQLEQLAACHNLCAFTLLYSWAPSSLLVRWLNDRGRELLEDDLLLLEEDDIDGLTTLEVVDACLRRGILSKGLHAQSVLESGTDEDEDESESSESAIEELLASNWDISELRDRLQQWARVVASVSCLSDSALRERNISLYVHASALGIFASRK